MEWCCIIVYIRTLLNIVYKLNANLHLLQVNCLVILDTHFARALHGVARMDTCVPVHPHAYPWRKFIKMTVDSSSIFYAITTGKFDFHLICSQYTISSLFTCPLRHRNYIYTAIVLYLSSQNALTVYL